MEPFTVHRGIAVPLLRANVDTDAIIPSREMKRVTKTGFAEGLFAGWRYRDIDSREPDPSFVLNQARYAGASILVAGDNFGCGSSREHAVWALKEYGFRAVLAPSFGVIFRDNCIRNGLLPVVIDEATLRAIVEEIDAGDLVTVDLRSCQISTPGGSVHSFHIPSAQRDMLLEGSDPVALTLKLADRIDAFQELDRLERPWIYLDHSSDTANDDARTPLSHLESPQEHSS